MIQVTKIKSTASITIKELHYFGLAAMIMSSALMAVVMSVSKVQAATPPTPQKQFGLLAAGERSAILTETTGNNTTTNNGTAWYYRTSWSMGFARAGDTVNLNSCDISSDPGSQYKMCWHTNSGQISSGYRAGNVYPNAEGARYIYQSNTLPTYYPSGPQLNVTESTVLDGGWALCWAGNYSQSSAPLSDIFTNSCTGTYLMYAYAPVTDNLMDITRNGTSILYEYGADQNGNIKLRVGDTINLSLVTRGANEPVAWSHYKVYQSTCIVIDDCWPGGPMSSPGNWDSGTLVTNGTYTVPAQAENEQLYVYQADDSTGEKLTDADSTRLYVAHIPINKTVSSCEELAAIDDDTSARQYEDNYTLTQDIDCTGVDFGTGLFADDFFTGIFDGQNHVISNITIDVPEDYYVGLFSGTNGATIKDITLSGGLVTGASYVGGLIGEASSTNIQNVKTDLDVTGSDTDGYDVGGLVGEYNNYDRVSSIIENVAVTGDVTGAESNIGGLLGDVNVDGYSPQDVELAISKSYYSGTVTAGYDRVGGLIGDVDVENEDDDYAPARLLISNSYSQGAVLSQDGYDAGGLIGNAESYNDGYNSIAEIVIDRSYSSASVSANGNVGGLIGYLNLYYPNEKATISNSFAASSVTGDDSFAIIGGDYFADNDGEFLMENTYFDLTRTGQNRRSYNDGIENGFGKNDLDSEPNYFTNNTTNPPLNTWDFDTIWQISDSYPVLRNTFPESQSAGTQIIFPNGDQSKAILIEQLEGTEICSGFDDGISTQTEAQLNARDIAFDYDSFIVGFTMTGCNVGGTTKMKIVFTGDFNTDNLVLRKFNGVNRSFTTIQGATISKTTLNNLPAIEVLYQITDGGELDQDGTANGTIVDPVGLAKSVINAPNTGLERIR